MKTDTHVHRRIIREVALAADNFYQDAKNLGAQAAQALTSKKRSQITGLESLANSTQKVSDVCNYIKTRTARQNEWKNNDFGRNLLSYIETDLARKRDNVVTNLNQQSIKTTQHQQQEIYILLIRAFVAQLAAQYEFAVMEQGVMRQ